jgi:hypothetical protein
MPDSDLTAGRLSRRSLSQSSASGVIGLAGLDTGRSSAIGWPCRVITTFSPLSARSMSLERLFLASTTLCFVIQAKLAN